MMDRRRFAEAADMLDARYDFERKSEFMGRKEESLRELYHFCRDQERKPAEQEKKLSYFVYFTGWDAHDPNYGLEEFFAPEEAKAFIDMKTEKLKGGVFFTILGERVVIAPAAKVAEPAPPTAAQCPSGDPAAADPPA